MKKLLIISALLMAAFQIQASSYFTMGVRDTVYINPASSGLICEIPVKAHFESRYDSWTMTMTFPDGLAGDPVQNIPSFVAARDTCMDITYVTSDGTSDIYEAVLTDNDTTYTCSSTITEYGYWDPDNDGIYETYGTIKWAPRDYDSMFKLTIRVRNYFRTGFISISGEMTSTYDARGGTSTGIDDFEKYIFVKVGFRKGDVNGDGNIDINDLSIIVSIVLGTISPNEFQADAADYNCDGIVDIDDFTALNARLLGGQ